MNYILFDLECTCWKGSPPELAMEIIEIGAVCVDDFGEVVDEFQAFVRPVVNPILSGFCRELTTIQQTDVNRAKTFPNVIEPFLDWANISNGEEYYLISWGAFDKKQLQKDCALHRLKSDWTEKHLNLKELYREKKRFRSGIGLAKAVEIENLVFTGTHHRAIADAQNLAKIFIKHFGTWAF